MAASRSLSATRQNEHMQHRVRQSQPWVHGARLTVWGGWRGRTCHCHRSLSLQLYVPTSFICFQHLQLTFAFCNTAVHDRRSSSSSTNVLLFSSTLKWSLESLCAVHARFLVLYRESRPYDKTWRIVCVATEGLEGVFGAFLWFSERLGY